MRETRISGVRLVDLESPTREEVFSLAETFPLHELNLEDCLSKTRLTKVERHRDYLFIILHFPLWKEVEGYSALRVSFFLGRDFLVTIHEDKVDHIEELFVGLHDTFEAGSDLISGPGHLLLNVLHPIVEGVVPLMEELHVNLEKLKESVFSPRREALVDIARVRHDISDLRRIIGPLRAVVSRLRDDIRELTGEDLSIYHSDIRDHLEEIWELYDEIRELVEIYKDTDFTLYQQVTNRVLIVLTVIFTLTIPISIVSSLYGMNILLPGGVETGPFTFLGPYTTLVALTGISLIPALVMLVYFRRQGWI